MIKAAYTDKDLVMDILTRLFETKQSVNYTIRQDERKLQVTGPLMDHSFEFCFLLGEVLLSPVKKALVLCPDRKRTLLSLYYLKLIFSSLRLQNIRKIHPRKTLIKKVQPNERRAYLWFIGKGKR